MLEQKVFNYGQWTVTLIVRESFDKVCPVYVSIDCTGNWTSTQGILYDYYRECCAYNDPYILPKGLKDKIHKIARKMIEKYY